MNQIFIEILNNALTASVLILAVVIARLLIKKAPKWITCLMWGLVAIRLIIPFKIESVLSLIPSARPIPSDIEYQKLPQIESGLPVINQIVNPVIGKSLAADPISSVNPMQVILFIAEIIWILGIVGLFTYSLISYMLLRKKVAASQKISNNTWSNKYGNVYICDEVKSPFILGIFRPRIYMPLGMDEATRECVLAHEKAHLRRLDHLWKPIGFVILAVYWFNPLCWIAYILLCKDIELACDERVTRDMDKEWKALYCQALLDCQVSRRSIAACPVAFGEVSIKDRVKSVLSYKKPAVWLVALAIIISAVVGVCFVTSPKSSARENQSNTKEDKASYAGLYVYEYEGIGGQFYIYLGFDGRYTYYEGPHSSYIGYGNWSVKDGVITLIEAQENGQGKAVNRFRVEGNNLAWIEDGSRNFMYITLKDGAVFNYSSEVDDMIITPGSLSGEEVAIEEEGSTEELTEDKTSIVDEHESIEVTAPQLDLSADSGADGSRIYYADAHKFIFGGYYGLFVYDMDEGQIVRAVDLKSIGCDATQGDEYCEINVTSDGECVLLHPVNGNDMYVYNTYENSMYKCEYSLDGFTLYENEFQGEEKTKYASYDMDGEKGLVCLVNSFGPIGDLAYVPDAAMSNSYLVFADK